jgi:hypothetical protein
MFPSFLYALENSYFRLHVKHLRACLTVGSQLVSRGMPFERW